MSQSTVTPAPQQAPAVQIADVRPPSLPGFVLRILRKLITFIAPLLPEPESSESFLRSSEAQERGDLSEASNHLAAVLQECPDHAGALFSLGVQQLMQQDIERSLRSIELAIQQIAPSEYVLLCYADLLWALQYPSQALSAYFDALGQFPDSWRLESTLGFILEYLDRGKESLYHLRRAIALNPDCGPAWAGIANLDVEKGDGEAAIKGFRKAIDRSPTIAANYLSLADLGGLRLDSPDYSRLKTISQDGSRPISDRAVAWFAIGSVFEQAQDARAALSSYVNAGSLLRPTITYNEAAVLDRMLVAQREMSRDFVSQSHGEDSELPIFVVGMPRSGSTLVEQVLASHEDVFGAGEINLLNGVLVRNGVQLISLKNTTPRQLEFISHDYCSALKTIAPRAKRIVNKLLSNHLWAGLIHASMPGARIIHTFRSPIDTCVSCFSKYIPVPFSYDLGELGRYYDAYGRLMNHWRSVLPQEALLHVRYEDVVADLEGQARRIVEFCGLPWSDRCLKFYETQRQVRTASQNQVRKPVYNSAVGKWADCEDLLRPLIDALGSCCSAHESMKVL